ncbi:hypothetical protein [Faecalibaculum rodentium]|uniref:hypothetical protein n=1 Tax=Faecalibaculum rodentium TaxID=1702221 RepID=UPI003F67D11B
MLCLRSRRQCLFLPAENRADHVSRSCDPGGGHGGHRPEASAKAPGSVPNQQAWNCLQSFTDYARYFLDSREGEAAKEYCRKRKLSDEILETFESAGPPGSQRQDRFFQGKGWGRDMLVKTGLLQAETGRPVFTDRLLIPIHEPCRSSRGYTARTLAAGADIPKYVNTPATPCTPRGTWYSITIGQNPLPGKPAVILVEGAMDVIGLAKAASGKPWPIWVQPVPSAA